MFGIGYGYSPTSMDDTYIKMTEEAIKLVLEGGGPGSMLVDFLPIRASSTISVLFEAKSALIMGLVSEVPTRLDAQHAIQA